MSYKLAFQIGKCVLGNRTAKDVLRCLADYANEDGSNCFPGGEIISAETEMNIKSVAPALKFLESSNWIRILRHQKNNSNKYFINVQKIKAEYAQKRVNPKLGIPENGLTQKRIYSTPENGYTVSPKTGIDSINTQSTIQSVVVNKDKSPAGNPSSEKIPHGESASGVKTQDAKNVKDGRNAKDSKDENKAKDATAKYSNSQKVHDEELSVSINPNFQHFPPSVKTIANGLLQRHAQAQAPSCTDACELSNGQPSQTQTAPSQNATSPNTKEDDRPDPYSKYASKRAVRLPFSDLPQDWLDCAHDLRPDLSNESIDTAFRQFAFYFTKGKKANAYKTIRGWNQSWGNWIGRHREATANMQPPQAVQPVFAQKPEDVDKQIWNDFNASRKTPLTQTAFDELKKEVEKVKEKYPEQTLSSILSLCCAKDWKSFQATYFFNDIENNKNSFADPSSKPINDPSVDIVALFDSLN